MSIRTEIKSDASGTLTKVLALPDAWQRLCSTLAIVNFVGTEVPIKAPSDGYVLRYLIEEGSAVNAGQSIAIFIAPD